MFVVDAAAGMTPADLEAAEILRRAKAPVIVAVNKADNEKRELEGAEFYALGWEETYPISATHGRGTGDLLDSIVWSLPPESDQELARKTRDAEAEAWADEVAAGRLEPFVVGDAETDDEVGEDDGDARSSTPKLPDGTRRSLPRPTPSRLPSRSSDGPTSASRACSTRCSARSAPSSPRCPARPAMPSTRGSRGVAAKSSSSTPPGSVGAARWRPGPTADKYSTLRALRALSRADVAVLVIDAVEGLTAQDAHVAGYAVEEGKGLVLAVNKWDLLVEKTDRTFDQYVEWIRNEVPFLDFAPIVSISAKTGQRVGRVLEAAVDIWAERRRRVSTGELNRMLMAAVDRTPPPPVRGRRPKIFYVTQAAVAPPTFVFFASDASAVHFSYRRYLENRLRETFGFDGTPIKLVFRTRSSVKLPRKRKTTTGGVTVKVTKAAKKSKAAKASAAAKARRPS